MQPTASLEAGDALGSVMRVGVATVSVSGKLAQFSSRLLVPVSDAPAGAVRRQLSRRGGGGGGAGGARR